MSVVMAQGDQDPRLTIAEQLTEVMETVNATTTQTFVDAAARLKDELAPGTPPEAIAMHLMTTAAKMDAERGVVWPQIDPEQFAACGHDWHIFPNTVVLPGVTSALCYRARPNGYDPNSCIFEVYVIERFPEGQEPRTVWVHEPDPTEARWRLILSQDFMNMEAVQRGTKSRGFPGPRPSPVQEIPVIHFHRILAHYMGTGAPQPL